MTERSPFTTDKDNAGSKPAAGGYASSSAPQITLPKGGGAIKSIDEKFSVNAANGTAGCSFPFPFSASRNGFMPGMTLSYSSGGGNGVFGLGWNAEPPSIVRKTEKGLPLYHDAEDSDTFIFSGAEDLVPVYKQDGSGNWIKDRTITAGTSITRYRPRIEGGFARIERIGEPSGNVYWKVTTGNNEVSVFGKSQTAQVTDPADPARIFKWLLEFSYDDKGNCHQYEYKKEDKTNVPDQPHERNRLNDLSTCTQTYLKGIKYCNKVHFDRSTINWQNWDAFLSGIEYLLELVLDYGEHDPAKPQPADDNGWTCRTDPFSDYRAGFEIRTWRLCRRILMFHHFAELGGQPCLVRSMDLGYTAGTAFTFLSSIAQKGYIRKPDGSYSEKSLPAVVFTYETLGWNTEINALPAGSGDNLPTGIDDHDYQWIDLYNEGIAGILSEKEGAWYYKANAGNGNFNGTALVAKKPSLKGIAEGFLHFQDLEARGQQFLISRDLKGYFELGDDQEWAPFRNFSAVPDLDWQDPNLKLLDLNGDGMTDILISEDEVFTWYAARGKEGYADLRTIQKNIDEEKGPAIVFADSTQSIVLADMSGDGMMDIVRIRYSEVSYWPNLGYGRFGAKVNMSNAPVFDTPESFNPHYLKLADLDGSGTTDIVYLGGNSFSVYFNQAGNSWSKTNIINGVNPLPFPAINEHASVSIVDLLGNGTGCIVWSSSLPQHANAPLRYIDLMGGKKPHILTGYKNNMGKEVNIHYKPSTFYYLADKKAGVPWMTRLPFPVQCVSDVEMIDQIRESRFTNQYSYHHGYYDHAEREFRGFGRVDQTDTEDYEQFKKQSNPDGSTRIVDEGFHQPPVLTKTWYHTGAFPDKEKVFSQFAHEYYQNSQFPEQGIIDPPLPAGLTVDEWREALRACKSLPLRVEVYSPDSSEQAPHPYTTAQHSCLIQFLQPRLNDQYAVFHVQESESLSYTYERNPADPRITHSMNIEVDAFGNVLKAATISYGRKTADPDLVPTEQAEQGKIHIVFSQSNVTNLINEGTDYHLPIGYEALTYELTGFTPATGDYLTIPEIRSGFAGATVLAYQSQPTAGNKEKRLIEQLRTLFTKNDLSGPADLGVIESLALPWQAFKLSLTPDLRTYIYGDKLSDDLLMNAGKYVHFNDGNYWIGSGTQLLDPAHFYQVTEVTDPFGFKTAISYDAAYRFFVQQTTDALGSKNSIVGFNFRTLSPYLIEDINDNRSGLRTDELGMVISSFTMGKPGENKGDLLDASSVEVSANDQPTAIMEYNLSNYIDTGKPNFTRTTLRETHYFDSLSTGQAVIWQTSYTYVCGGGRPVMIKAQADPGLALQENADGTVVEVDTTPALRWVGNGRTVLNNKGKAVKQYEPYYSASPEFEDASQLVERGVTPIITYDPVGREIRRDLPDGTFIRVEFDSWMQRTFDQNDTVQDSQWYKDRIKAPVPGIATPAEIAAANKALIHANTPAVIYLDSLGRTIVSIADNGSSGRPKTRTLLDIEGNPLSITDARGNLVMQYKYDMLGAQLYHAGMDGGERWLFNDVMGKPLRFWDSRGHLLRNEYDTLHRPVKSFVSTDGAAEINTVRTTYGEGLANDKQLNLRGRAYQHFDAAGIATNPEYDFKGNPPGSSRQLCTDYKSSIDWNTAPAMDPTVFTSSAVFDALNRPIMLTLPDRTIITPGFNAANLLNTIAVQIRGVGEKTNFVKGIGYDAKAQRQSIAYGNNTLTRYQYETRTFRLKELSTTGKNGTDLLQKLQYTYDPVGNIISIQDLAQQTLFFNNAVVDPSTEYTYDAIYQLITASGREHIGQNQTPSEHDEHRTNLPAPGDGSAMRSYTQNYQYDAVGNILQMIHAAGTGSWTRIYNYETANNRLKNSTVNTTTEAYTYDAHGNMQTMDSLPALTWDHKDQLQIVDLGGGGMAYYVYDGTGQRIRKVIERQGGIKEDRIYLGAFERYQKTSGGNIQEETETVHVSDDNRRVALVETKTIKAGIPSSDQLIRYQYSNHLSSSSLELDEQGAILSYEEYHPFGTTSYQAVSAAISAAIKRFRYTGMERDDETGLEYHSARYYLPWLGRWLSADPKGMEAGNNFYAYTSNNPVLFTDISGLDPDKVLVLGHTQRTIAGQVVDLTIERGDKAILNTGMEPIMIGDMKDFDAVFELIGEDVPLSSGTMLQAGLEGEEGVKALHMYLKGVDDVLAHTHTSGELRNLIAAIQSNTHKVDIYFAHPTGGDVSIFRAGSQQLEGAPLPGILEPHLNFNPEPPLGFPPPAGGAAGGEGAVAHAISADSEVTARILTSSSTGSHLASDGGRVASRIGVSTLEAGEALSTATKVLKYTGKGVAIAGKAAGIIITAYYVGKHGYLFIQDLREGRPSLEGLYLLEDLSPVPSARPQKISIPGLSANQSWAKSDQHFTGVQSGCTTCHESVRADYWSKSTVEGRNAVRLNGPATGENGIAYDWAIRQMRQ